MPPEMKKVKSAAKTPAPRREKKVTQTQLRLKISGSRGGTPRVAPVNEDDEVDFPRVSGNVYSVSFCLHVTN